jgi:hypothetical protein
MTRYDISHPLVYIVKYSLCLRFRQHPLRIIFIIFLIPPTAPLLYYNVRRNFLLDLSLCQRLMRIYFTFSLISVVYRLYHNHDRNTTYYFCFQLCAGHLAQRGATLLPSNHLPHDI